MTYAVSPRIIRIILLSLTIPFVLGDVAGCGMKKVSDEQIEVGRKTIKDSLRDPESAQFRNERIRTLWSKNGSRLTVYCSEVNANNAFGGKSGYEPARVVLSANGRPGDINDVPQLSKYEVLNRVSTTYFDRCVRADVQRRDQDMFMNYLDMGELDVDGDFKAFPVQSLDPAPELRK